MYKHFLCKYISNIMSMVAGDHFIKDYDNNFYFLGLVTTGKKLNGECYGLTTTVVIT